MKISLRATAIAAGVLWGVAIFLVGIGNLISPYRSYGFSFLEAVSSVYPGFRPYGGFGNVLTGTVYGLVDGAIAGLFFGWIYNLCVGDKVPKTSPAASAQLKGLGVSGA